MYTIIEGLGGAAKIFNTLCVDFQDNRFVTQTTQDGNPYTFIVKEDKELFLTVYDESDAYGHHTRVTFGPSEILPTVKQTLETVHKIKSSTIQSRINNDSGNLDVVTLEFDHNQTLDGEQFLDGEVKMIRALADTVVEALFDLYSDE
jgi:hypothetical protein